MTPKVQTAILAVIVAACAFLAYTGSLNNGYIWDDPIVLKQQMVAFREISDAFVPPLNIPQFGIFYYRPLVVLSYMLDKSFTGPRPMDIPEGAINPFHVSVVVYHTIVTVLVFLFGLVIFHHKRWGRWAAFAGGVLFAVHPIHTESVCWMAGRSDILASVGLVPAMALFVLGRRKNSPRLMVAAAAAYLVGLLGKETGIAALLALPALALVPLRGEDPPASGPETAAKVSAEPGRKKRGKRGRRQGARSKGFRRPAVPSKAWTYGPFVVATVIYWMMRYQDLNRTARSKSLTSLLVSSDLTSQRSNPFEWSVDILAAVGFYVRKVLVPTNLNAFVAEVPARGAMVALAIVVLALAGGGGYYAWRRGARTGIALGAVFFATLAPSLAIATYSISEAPVAERYLYIPSIAVCLGAPYLVGILIERLRGRSPALGRAALFVSVAGGLALAAVFGTATSIRNETWRNDLAFWEDAVAKAPHQGLPHLHLGLAYDRMQTDDEEERERYDELAEREFRLALDESVTYDVEGRSTAWNNLANIHLSRGDYEEAEKAFRNSIRMRPRYQTPHYGLGLLNYRRALASQRAGDGTTAYRQMQEANEWLQKAIQLNPRYVKAHLLAGTVLMHLQQNTRARRHLEEVIRLDEGSSQAARAQTLLERIQARTPAPAGPQGG